MSTQNLVVRTKKFVKGKGSASTAAPPRVGLGSNPKEILGVPATQKALVVRTLEPELPSRSFTFFSDVPGYRGSWFVSISESYGYIESTIAEARKFLERRVYESRVDKAISARILRKDPSGKIFFAGHPDKDRSTYVEEARALLKEVQRPAREQAEKALADWRALPADKPRPKKPAEYKPSGTWTDHLHRSVAGLERDFQQISLSEEELKAIEDSPEIRQMVRDERDRPLEPLSVKAEKASELSSLIRKTLLSFGENITVTHIEGNAAPEPEQAFDDFELFSRFDVVDLIDLITNEIDKVQNASKKPMTASASWTYIQKNMGHGVIDPGLEKTLEQLFPPDDKSEEEADDAGLKTDTAATSDPPPSKKEGTEGALGSS